MNSINSLEQACLNAEIARAQFNLERLDESRLEFYTSYQFWESFYNLTLMKTRQWFPRLGAFLQEHGVAPNRPYIRLV